jgi:hypothetical protein
MTSEELRSLAATLREQASIDTAVKTAQLVEALAGLALLKQKLGIKN